MLTNDLGNSPLTQDNTTICEMSTPLFMPTLTTSAMQEQQSSDIQAELDKIRSDVEKRAEHFFPGIMHALTYQTSDAAATKPAWLGIIKDLLNFSPFAPPKENEEPLPEVTGLTEVSSRAEVPAASSEQSNLESLWPENEHYQKIEVGHDRPVHKIPFDRYTLADFFTPCLENPTVENCERLSDFTRTFREQIPTKTVFDMLTALMKQGFSKNSDSSIERERYLVASHLSTLFYSRMSTSLRLALVQYAITSYNKDMFDVLANAHQATLQDHTTEFTILNDLIVRMQQNPNHFELFKNNLAEENRADILYGQGSTIAIDLDENAFMNQMTHCYQYMRQESDATAFQNCMNAARLEGFRRHRM